jgi:hypothetical protein
MVSIVGVDTSPSIHPCPCSATCLLGTFTSAPSARSWSGRNGSPYSKEMKPRVLAQLWIWTNFLILELMKTTRLAEAPASLDCDLRSPSLAFCSVSRALSNHLLDLFWHPTQTSHSRIVKAPCALPAQYLHTKWCLVGSGRIADGCASKLPGSTIHRRWAGSAQFFSASLRKMVAHRPPRLMSGQQMYKSLSYCRL